MGILFMAIGLLALGAIGALACAWSPRLSTFVGVAGAILGGTAGLVAALLTVVRGTSSAWVRPWSVPGGSLSLGLDPLSAWFLLPIFGVTAVAAVYGAEYLRGHHNPGRIGSAWFFYNTLTISMVAVVLARNGILFLVAWEVMSLSSYMLVTFDDEDERVCAAGRTYLIAMHLGTAFLLAFFLLLGRQAGSLDFEAILAGGPQPATRASLLFVLAVVGFGTKAGFMPFHVWLPEAHPAAPSFVSAVMSGVMVKTGIYGLLRALTLLPAAPAWWGCLLVGIGIISGIWGVLFALAQHDLKRLLAYHTVENIGIIGLGLGTGLLGASFGVPLLAVLGLSGALFHVVNHALFKGLLFLGAGAVVHATGTRDIDHLGGLARCMPVTALAFIVGAVAIVGLPPLNGFASEFLIYQGAFRAVTTLGPAGATPGLLVIGALALIGGLAAICFTKVVGIVFLGEPRTEAAATAHPPGVLMVAPMVILALGCLLVGLFASVVIGSIVPIAAEVVHLPFPVPSSLASAATAPLASVVGVGVVLLVATLVLSVLRRLLLSGRSVESAGTWDCGYARPTARMQYTASSYVQPTTALFGGLLHTRTELSAPSGLFPHTAAFSTETLDVCEEVLYRPIFGAVVRATGRLHWLQQGSVHLYAMYIAVTLIVLLIWFVGVTR